MAQVIKTIKHSIFRTFSVLCVLAVIALLGLGIKRLLYPRATENYAQKAENITNVENYFYPQEDSSKVTLIKFPLPFWNWQVKLIDIEEKGAKVKEKKVEVKK